MEEVFIMTRDVNGKRNYHYLRWDDVCSYVEDEEGLQDEEILMVMVNDICIYSALGACASCPLQPTTLKEGIEKAIINAVPDVKEVRLYLGE